MRKLLLVSALATSTIASFQTMAEVEISDEAGQAACNGDLQFLAKKGWFYTSMRSWSHPARMGHTNQPIPLPNGGQPIPLPNGGHPSPGGTAKEAYDLQHSSGAPAPYLMGQPSPTQSPTTQQPIDNAASIVEKEKQKALEICQQFRTQHQARAAYVPHYDPTPDLEWHVTNQNVHADVLVLKRWYTYPRSDMPSPSRVDVPKGSVFSLVPKDTPGVVSSYGTAESCEVEFVDLNQ